MYCISPYLFILNENLIKNHIICLLSQRLQRKFYNMHWLAISDGQDTSK